MIVIVIERLNKKRGSKYKKQEDEDEDIYNDDVREEIRVAIFIQVEVV